jgi:hypothetical protein
MHEAEGEWRSRGEAGVGGRMSGRDDADYERQPLVSSANSMASFGEPVGWLATELRRMPEQAGKDGRSPTETVVQGLMRR